MQFKFNLDDWFNIYSFFSLEFACMWVISSQLSTLVEIITPCYPWKQFCNWAENSPFNGNSSVIGLTTAHLIPFR